MTLSLHTPICDLLGCRYPVIQTAMGWVADARLVAAVGNAGGFGFLAAATLPADRLESEIRQVLALTDQPFGVNFHMFQANAEQVLALIVKYRVRAASYGRGADRQSIDRLKQAGVICIPTVGAVRHARKAVELGADALVIQGSEGGGHTGVVPTSMLLPMVLDAVSVPVLAAGGLHDGRGLAAALACGAQGIAMGTRFLLTEESPVPAATLECYLSVSDPAIIRVSLAVDGLPQRMIDNPTLQRLERSGVVRQTWQAVRSAWHYKQQAGLSPFQSLRVALGAWRADSELSLSMAARAANAPQLIRLALNEGRPDDGVLPSGQVAANIDRLQSCAHVIETIVVQARQRLLALQGWMAKTPEVKV